MALNFVEQQRWTPKRKAALLAEIDAGGIESDKFELLGISEEELATWRRDFSANGVCGLHVCSLHHYHPSRRKALPRRHRA